MELQSISQGLNPTLCGIMRIIAKNLGFFQKVTRENKNILKSLKILFCFSNSNAQFKNVWFFIYKNVLRLIFNTLLCINSFTLNSFPENREVFPRQSCLSQNDHNIIPWTAGCENAILMMVSSETALFIPFKFFTSNSVIQIGKPRVAKSSRRSYKRKKD